MYEEVLAYQEGLRVGMSGGSRDECPWNYGPNWEAWHQGFREATELKSPAGRGSS